jgi:hypothetical protein
VGQYPKYNGELKGELKGESKGQLKSEGAFTVKKQTL